jgi:ubiquinone/menaquinone biosynthesis C-methylase UbiE
MTNTLLYKIDQYWDNRAEGYSKVNQEELAGSQKKNWLREISGKIEEAYPKHQPSEIKILDIGTGPGFFAIIMAKAGYQVTAVDFTKAMLTQAKKNAKELAERIQFLQMDGQHLTFPENSFDVVISRNLTWVLEEPGQAYHSWTKVLNKNGLLLNFDANWYGYLYDERKLQAYEQDRIRVEKMSLEDHYTCTDIDAMEEIARQVPLSRIQRPQWDMDTLQELEMKQIKVDLSIWERVWSQTEKINYASTPMFMITAVK